MPDDIKSSEDKNNQTDLSQNYMAVKAAPPEEPTSQSPSSAKPKKTRRVNITKKQKIILGVSAILIVALSIGGMIIFGSNKPDPQPQTITQTKPEPVKTTEPSRLTGLEVNPEINKRTVTGIMIENSPDARPQSGLKDAGIIYEAVAEGGITRFLALFQDTQPEYVGPVRSVRPYYLDFITPYDARIAHVGGSPVALEQIRQQKLKDLNQCFNPGPFWRERTRYAPHNMYTNVVKLKELEKQKGWKASEYKTLLRGEESKPADIITAKNINIIMSSTLYNVSYEYDKTTNSYLRSEGGKPHKDFKSNKQLAPKIVVVPVIPRTQDGIYSVYAINGSGKVLVFQNGTVTEGTWKKSGRKDQFTFTKKDGTPLKLAAGQTWITIAATSANISYKP